ncbi:MAG: T9SS type A sorting domain-containing protein [Aureispira sp.]
MRTILQLLLSLCTPISICFGQTIAGVVPLGSSLSPIGTTITVQNVYEEDTLSLDLDNDGQNDCRFKLTKGPTAIDGPNTLGLEILNASFEVMETSLASYSNNVVNYSNGDTITTGGVYSWGTDSLNGLGNFGCMLCPGPVTGINKYIAFRKGSVQGWINLSFNLQDSNPLYLTVHSITQENNQIGVFKIESENSFNVFPNPSTQNYITVEGDEVVEKIEVFDVSGRLVLIEENKNVIELAETGLFLIKIHKRNGGIEVHSLRKN